jgi:hypothetical protein
MSGRFEKGGVPWNKGHHTLPEGHTIKKRGYVFVYVAGHPTANYRGFVPRARLVMEGKLGRYLKPGETISRINGVRDDDRIENLKLCGSKAEQLESWQFKKGDPSPRKGLSFKWSEESKKKISGSNRHNWKGGLQKSFGYVYILMPDHPNAGVRKTVARARLIMEEHLGRYLEPGETVVHINGIKDDDRIENLKLCGSRSEQFEPYKFRKGCKSTSPMSQRSVPIPDKCGMCESPTTYITRNGNPEWHRLKNDDRIVCRNCYDKIYYITEIGEENYHKNRIPEGRQCANCGTFKTRYRRHCNRPNCKAKRVAHWLQVDGKWYCENCGARAKREYDDKHLAKEDTIDLQSKLLDMLEKGLPATKPQDRRPKPRYR